MIRKNLLTVAIAGTLGTVAFLPFNALAQSEDETIETDALLEEVVVTGSAIKRSDLTSILPIQVITEMDIQEQGVQTTAELIAKVPAMQNYVTPGDTVGGGGGGLQTANLRGIGTQYTLVLLNGRRIAPADSGSTFDVQGIPLAAIKRVEILTDGASALYGADAIAGVVNFILKDSVDATKVAARYDMPEHNGGESWDASIVTGAGDVLTDGYSFVFTYQHQDQDNLPSADRDFAKTGFIRFNHDGQELYFQNSSSNAIPGNAYVYGLNPSTGTNTAVVRFLNPYFEANGACHPQSTQVLQSDGYNYGCAFDYTSTLQVMPESESDNLYMNGQYMVTDDIKLFGTVVYSTGTMTARIAPYPSGQFPIPLDSPLLEDYVYPYLTPEERAAATRVTATWRGIPAGNRTYEFDLESTNITVGAEGTTGPVDWNAAYTYTTGTNDQSYPDGWLLLDPFLEATSNALFNPFVYTDELTDEDQEVIDGFVYHGQWDKVETEMNIIEGRGSMALFSMGGGEMQMAAGFDWRSNSYDRWVAPANLSESLLFLSPDTPYNLERDQWGAFVEALFPFSNNFEATASLRYDDIDGVKDTLRGETYGSGDSGTTYKVSARWTASDWLALRASYGTGFKPPSMREIGAPREEFGVTSANFFCPFDASDPYSQYCVPGEQQYNVYLQGNPNLLFEESTQWTAGFVFTPPGWNFDATIDYWVVDLENLVETLTEEQIFDNPDLYREWFTTKMNTATGLDELAIIQAYVNVGTKDNEGIDYNLHYAWDASWADVDFNLLGTHMLESDSSLTGSSLGKFGNDQQVVFEDKFQFMTTVTFENWTHALVWEYKSSYTDQDQTVEVLGTGAPVGQGPTIDVQLTVPSYDLWSYNVRWDTLDDRLGLTFGIRNIFDDEPPLSLRSGGAGHQVGWDPRYTDAYGRTYWLQGEFSFNMF